MSNNGIKFFSGGEILVTGTGDLVVDEIIPRSRALLVHPEQFVTVRFDPNECGPAPCATDDVPELLAWELFFLPVKQQHHNKHHAPEEELRLRIKWSVSTAKTIVYKITVPV